LNVKIVSGDFYNRYEVFNSYGQIVKTGELDLSILTINTSDLPQGFYIISFNGKMHQRFQIIR
jgi:hypothetical protein